MAKSTIETLSKIHNTEFKNWYEYHNFIAKGNGYEGYYDYLTQRAQSRGYDSYWGYIKDSIGYEIQDEFRVKDRYEDKCATAEEIPSMPGYYVTPEAEIWKYNAKFKAWIIISQQTNYKSGYKTFQPYVNGKRTVKYVHRAVAETYLGYPGDNYECHHINGDNTQNNIENLQWMEKDIHRGMKKSKNFKRQKRVEKLQELRVK